MTMISPGFKRLWGQSLFFIAGALPFACEAQNLLLGTWELTYVAPITVDYSDPRGITNTKLLFTEDGRLFVLKPDEVSISGSKGKTQQMSVSFPDAETMILLPPSEMKAIPGHDEGQRRFKRIDRFDIKLEPKSIELVQIPSTTTAETTYDSKDYSQRATEDRLRGKWEVIAYRNVPRDQAPPFGFFNDLWTIKSDAVIISRRVPAATDSVPFAISSGQFSSSGIILGGPVGSKIDWKFSFNEWGQLVLDSSYCRVILKLVTKDVEKDSVVPLKIVVLRLKGEE